MAGIPSIQIRLQNAQIGIETTKGRLEISQPPADMEMKTTPPKLEIVQPKGDLTIDQSQAWDALGCGPQEQFLNRIYSEYKRVALEGIARIVENGNRLADIVHEPNAIADIAAEQAFEPSDINYLGEASYSNVKLDYVAHPPEIQVKEGSVDIIVTPHKPNIRYTPGHVNIYMKQYPKVELIPPQIDIKR